MKKKTIHSLLILTLLSILILNGCRLYKGPSAENLTSYLEAKELYLKGDLTGAAPILEAVIKADKNFYQASFLLGKISYFSKNMATAEKYFSGILAKHPAHAEAEFWLVRVLLESGKEKEAEERLQKLLRYDSRDPRLLYQLAHVYLLKKDYKNALIALNEAALYREEFARVFLELGRIYNSFGQQDQALDELRFSKLLLPEDSALSRPLTELINKIDKH